MTKLGKLISSSPQPNWITPMLATLTEDYFSDPHWIYEEKFDGIRCIAIQKKGTLTLYSRNHKPLNATFPEIAEQLEGCCKENFILDGEIVTFEGKVSSFSKLQSRLNVLDISRVKGKIPPVYFCVFDCMYWDRFDLRKLPLIERKQLLKELFPFKKNIRYTSHVVGKGEAYLKQAAHKGWEGIIAKRKESIYLSKRSRDWLKFKCSKSQEFVIGGYTDPRGSRVGFGALLVGYYEKNKLKYAGKVGTGYDTETLIALKKKFSSLKQQSCSFEEDPEEPHAHFISPRLVCEIGFTEWTKDHKLRHPRYLGLRKDKKPKDVVRETPK